MMQSTPTGTAPPLLQAAPCRRDSLRDSGGCGCPMSFATPATTVPPCSPPSIESTTAAAAASSSAPMSQHGQMRVCERCYTLHTTPPPRTNKFYYNTHLEVGKQEEDDPAQAVARSQHFTKMVTQLVQSHHLDEKWIDVIASLALKAASQVSPRVCDKNYIGKYVKVKVVPEGDIAESAYVCGVGISKSPMHKKMPNNLQDCNVLLLNCPLEYHKREEHQLMSLDELLLREKDFLALLVAQVAAQNPHIVVVSKLVSRVAIDFFVQRYITVFSNMKPSVMKRLSRYLGADIVPSVSLLVDFESDYPKPKLGFCAHAHVATYEGEWGRKSITFFEGSPQLGGTVILRGAPEPLLRQVKHLLLFATCAAFNMHIEKDVFAGERWVPASLLKPEIPVLSYSPGVKFPERDRMLSHLLLCNDRNYLKMPFVSITFCYPARAQSEYLCLVREESCDLLHVTSSTTAACSCSTSACLPAISQFPLLSHPIISYQFVLLQYSISHRGNRMRCLPWSTLLFHYYSAKLDLCFGTFLMEHCFDPQLVCHNPQCGRPMSEHEQSFVHYADRVNITVDKLDVAKMKKLLPTLEEGADDKVITWTYCKACGKSSQPAYMTREKWNYSLGKLLENIIYAESTLKGCAHASKQLCRYYGYRSAALKIEYAPVPVYGVQKPPARISLRRTNPVAAKFVHRSIATISRMFHRINEYVRKYAGAMTDTLTTAVGGEDELQLATAQKAALLLRVRQFLADFAEESAPFTDSALEVPNDVDEVSKIRHHLFVSSAMWHARLRELEVGMASLLIVSRVTTPSLSKWKLRSSRDLQSTLQSALALENDRRRSLVNIWHPSFDVDGPQRETTPPPPLPLLPLLPLPPLSPALEDDGCLGSSSTSTTSFDSSGEIEQQQQQQGEQTDLDVEEDKDKPHGPLFQPKKSESKILVDHVRPMIRRGEMHMPPCSNGMCPIVDVNEISTFVSWLLCCTEYQKRLQLGLFFVAETEKEFLEEREAQGDLPDEQGAKPDIEPSFMEQLLSPDKTHIWIRTVYEEEGYEARITVAAFYAKQFRALRRLVFGFGAAAASPSVNEDEVTMNEEAFIKSLSRCAVYLARGGKSKALFRKTYDDRFILKQMSPPEFSGFLEFGPAYFRYMANIYAYKLPSLLVRIVGVYRVKLGKVFKYDLLVMENIFFGRTVKCVYDLKGSQYGRYERDPRSVQLDGNLVQGLHESPLCIDVGSKQELSVCLRNDTHFLASLALMDYSLLVGVSADSSELVMGLIDYVRMYTWDKHAETLVKGAVRRAAPTIVAPYVYQDRFCCAVHTYFTVVPSIHDTLGAGFIGPHS
eukprot:TRINITY_DN5802_c0_g1_i7.p1 TRINITY_DN5802_c0_g1~~TRINITY_DN5802_c0_g1_i7.p1  ORF type:complete len:1326 (+),score=337.64 TRINITY_DN5802_c0_g1_i7:205-4182(+)